jgi:hypothetical protein
VCLGRLYCVEYPPPYRGHAMPMPLQSNKLKFKADRGDMTISRSRIRDLLQALLPRGCALRKVYPLKSVVVEWTLSHVQTTVRGEERVGWIPRQRSNAVLFH